MPSHLVHIKTIHIKIELCLRPLVPEILLRCLSTLSSGLFFGTGGKCGPVAVDRADAAGDKLECGRIVSIGGLQDFLWLFLGRSPSSCPEALGDAPRGAWRRAFYGRRDFLSESLQIRQLRAALGLNRSQASLSRDDS